jgi:pyruvate dehydrogenase E2 component (dihydrolipoamide acetyltransferase)
MDFKLPDIGEGVHEGEITKWLVKPGDTVKADQPMVEVMTDKATVEIPSPVTGTVDSLGAKEGETVKVGSTLLTIKEGGGAAKPAPKAEAKAQPAIQKTEASRDEAPPKASAPAAPAREERVEEEVLPFNVLATPATRKLARELDVNLKEVKGSGIHGRVTKLDVQMAAEGHQAATPRPSHTITGVESSSSTALAKAPAVPVGAVQRIPLKGLRKKIAEAMTRSKHTAAHFTYVEEVDMSEVARLRAGHKAEAEKRGVKLTFLPFILKALVPALKEFPYLNSSLDDAAGEIVLKGEYNIGVATDTPAGLIVPVIKSVDRKSIWDLAADIQALSERARIGKSTMDDLKGGTFTVTNAGSIGGVFATPVINHPEVAILGVNAVRKRPVVVEDQIVIRDMMFLSISVDHRVVDGADAARFMNRLVYFLSDPTRLVFA